MFEAIVERLVATCPYDICAFAILSNNSAILHYTLDFTGILGYNSA